MPTQPPTSTRPFFASFLSAFRSRTIPSAQASSITVSKTQTSPSSTSSQPAQPSSPPPTAPLSIASKPGSGPTSSALSQLHSPISPPLSRSRSPGERMLAERIQGERMSGLPSPSSYMTVQAHTQASSAARRRGSDSSNEGVRWQETMGEKWYIGGRNARGEEKYFKMGVVRRDRSLDRGSIDRMSL